MSTSARSAQVIDGIGVASEDGILTVTLDRPAALNALDVAAIRRLRAVLHGFDEDDTLRVAIITGGGERAFCTGADLKNTAPATESVARGWYADIESSLDNGFYVRGLSLRDLNLHKPLIAAVNGHALGAGLEIVLACDLRLASENATFGLPEARWASIPGAGGVSGLLDSVPGAVAMRMLLTGERIDALDARRWGLVSDVVAPPDLMATAFSAARAILANGPLSVRAILELAGCARDLPAPAARRMEQLAWGLLRNTEDRAEGRAAFAERRIPTYEGR